MRPASACGSNHGVTLPDELGDRAIPTQAVTNPDDELLANRCSETLKGLQRRPRAPTLDAGDSGLGGTHTLRQFGLCQTRFGTQPQDELAERRHPLLIVHSSPCRSGIRPVDLLPFRS